MVFIFYGHIWSQLRKSADYVDIPLGLVFIFGSPCRNDGSHRILVVTSDVTPKDNKASPQSVFHTDELFKGGVCRNVDLAQPRVSYADVEGVVVSYPSRNLLLNHILHHGCGTSARERSNNHANDLYDEVFPINLFHVLKQL